MRPPRLALRMSGFGQDELVARALGSHNPRDRRPALSMQRKIEMIVVVVALVFLFGFIATVFLSFLFGIG